MNTKNNLSINLRILQFIEHQGVSKYAFAKTTGISEQLLSNITRNKSKASIDVLQKILNNYVVNSKWLLTGEGSLTDDFKKQNLSNYTVDEICIYLHDNKLLFKENKIYQLIIDGEIKDKSIEKLEEQNSKIKISIKKNAKQ